MNSKKVILITGAASGVGKATARLFADKGWFVGLYDIKIKELKFLSDEIGSENCCYRFMDISDSKSVKSGIAHFSKQTGGRMNILFNNAGIIEMGLSENIDIQKEFKIIDVNVKGMLNCIRASLDLLKITEDSRIISMSSASSLYGTAYFAVYSATKAAVCSLTESLNLELDQYGIFVSDIIASFIDTAMLDQKNKLPFMEKFSVLLSPEDVAKIVWKSIHRKKIHNDTKGVLSLRLLMSLPSFLKLKILKSILLPGR